MSLLSIYHVGVTKKTDNTFFTQYHAFLMWSLLIIETKGNISQSMYHNSTRKQMYDPTFILIMYLFIALHLSVVDIFL